MSVCLSGVYACCVCFYHSVPGNCGKGRDAIRVDTPSPSPLLPLPSIISKRSKFALRSFTFS